MFEELRADNYLRETFKKAKLIKSKKQAPNIKQKI